MKKFGLFVVMALIVGFLFGCSTSLMMGKFDHTNIEPKVTAFRAQDVQSCTNVTQEASRSGIK